MRTTTLLLTLLAACTSGSDDVDVDDWEGDDAGECSDGADNDRDGAFDCDDTQCASSPDCTDPDTDTDADSDSDSDVDADADSDADADADADSDADSDADTDTDPIVCAGELCTLTAVTLEYSFSFDFWFDSPFTPDCTMTYTGSGAVVEADSVTGRLTFDGTWDQTSTDCNPTFSQIIWFDGSGEAFHTFKFGGGPGAWILRDWFAHGAPDAYFVTSPATSDQWYMTEIDTDIDLGTAFTYALTEGDPGTAADYVHALTVTFTVTP